MQINELLFHELWKTFKSKYIYFFILIFICFPLNNTFSLDINIISSSDIYDIDNNKKYNIRNLSPKVQNIFGSMFKVNYYYTNLYIGDSFEKQGFILDTGSSITTSSCSLCKKCGDHIYPPYEIGSSRNIINCADTKCKMTPSKCSDSKCSFRINYAEGSSLEGIFINKKVYFEEKNLSEEKNNVEIPLGCTLSENNLFYKQVVNGIMGLNNNEFNFIEILYKLGRIEKNIFSLCFAQLGGIFNVGEINNKIHISNITYFPMRIEKNKYYKINFKSISVNEKTIEGFSQEEDNNFILDSGATISYFNNKIFDEILNKMRQICDSFSEGGICGTYKLSSILGHCFYFNNTDELELAIRKYWPVIHFNIEGYDYKWLPENYFFNISTNNLTGACMGFNKMHRKRNTLGGSWFIGHDIIFDRENKLIGIAEADCHQNKNLNLTNGFEIFDLKLINYYKNKKKNFSLAIIKITNFLIGVIILLIIVFFFRYKKKNNKFRKKTFEIKDDILVNNPDIHLTITNNNNPTFE